MSQTTFDPRIPFQAPNSHENEEYFLHTFFTGEHLFPSMVPIDNEDIFNFSDFGYTSEGSSPESQSTLQPFTTRIKICCTSKSKGPYIRLGTFAIQIEISHVDDQFKQIDLYKNKKQMHANILYVELTLESLTSQKETLRDMCGTCRSKFLKTTMQTYGPLMIKDKFPVPIHNNSVKFKIAVGCNHNKPKNQQKLCALRCKVLNGRYVESVGSMLVSSGGGSAKSGEVKRDFDDFCKWSALVQSELKDNGVGYFALLPKSKNMVEPEVNLPVVETKDITSRKRQRTDKDYSSTDITFVDCVKEAYLFKLDKQISSRKLTDEDLEWMHVLCNETYKGNSWKFLNEWFEPTLQTIDMIPHIWTAVAQNGCRLIRGFISDYQCFHQLQQSLAPRAFIIRWSSQHPGSLVISTKSKDNSIQRHLLWRHGNSFLLLQSEPKLIPIKDFGGILKGLYNMQILGNVVDKVMHCGMDSFLSVLSKGVINDQVHYNLL